MVTVILHNIHLINTKVIMMETGEHSKCIIIEYLTG